MQAPPPHGQAHLANAHQPQAPEDVPGLEDLSEDGEGSDDEGSDDEEDKSPDIGEEDISAEDMGEEEMPAEAEARTVHPEAFAQDHDWIMYRMSHTTKPASHAVSLRFVAAKLVHMLARHAARARARSTTARGA